MIHEPAKWAGWQSTTAAAQHLDRLKQMQGQIYRIMAARSGKPLRQIIRDTKRVDFYLDAWKAKEYGLIDRVIGADTAPVRDEALAGEETTASSGEEPASTEISIHGRSGS
jgi:ATP-dependent protease ClpP protease subunit